MRLLTAAVWGLAYAEEEIFEMIKTKVFNDRPLIEVFTNTTFDPSTIPLLVEQAQQLVPYVMQTGSSQPTRLVVNLLSTHTVNGRVFAFGQER